jgi:AcrR family transcriptional regulator
VTKTATASVQSKAKYHHGDLREALIMAAYQLVSESGAESFSLADACRLAGVSAAAPYRHFKDREEILTEVTARGLGAMRANSVRAVEPHGEGTLAGIIAMGQAYVTFAYEQQGLFRLIFDHNPETPGGSEIIEESGRTCFGYLIEQVTQYCQLNGIERDSGEVAVGLWTFVHGAASLLINGKYDRVTPDFDIDEMIVRATPLLLGRTV